MRIGYVMLSQRLRAGRIATTRGKRLFNEDRAAVIGSPQGLAAPPALVAGASSPVGLAVARGLSHMRIPLVGLSAERQAPCCRSRLWHDMLTVRELTGSAWLAALRSAHERYGRMVLFPADDLTVRLVAEHAAELATMFDFVLPELPTVDLLLDKSIFHNWALANDFPVPRSVIVGNRGELRSAMLELSFPVVFKPFERTLAWQSLSMHDTVHRFDSAADLDRLSFDPFEAADRFILQEWISGRDSDVYFCLCYRGRHGDELAALVGRKITQWPVDVGSTALAVTHRDAELHKLTRRVLDAAGHVGFGSLEVRQDVRDGRMLITEPTVGRPDLQAALAAAAGVNLVEVAYHDAVKLPAPPGPPSREAIWVHETGFPRSVLVAIRCGRLDHRALLAAWRARRAVSSAFGFPSDPQPLISEVARFVRATFRSALRAARRPRRHTKTSKL